MISGKFTYPFCYTPHPLIVDAAARLMERLDADRQFGDCFRGGKMMGVLMAAAPDGAVRYLYSFSGLAGGKADIEGFVPPIYDFTAPEGYFRTREAQICEMPPGKDKSEASAALQSWLFDRYKVSNAFGAVLSIKEIFARKGLIPPAGTGDCAGPKLLQYAYSHSLKPLAMGEFWYGASPSSEVREQGRFYPACTGKCGPLLTFMLGGLDMDPNPLDKEFTSDSEPSVIFIDEDIIVADKPSGMLSVPGRTKALSLLEWLKGQYGEVHSCHRLDMDTSGVMIFARNLKSQRELERQFAHHQISKTYRARLASGPKPFGHSPQGTISLPLCLDYYDRPRQIVDYAHGKLAITDYRVLEMLPNGEIDILFMPKTGRTHQLRVHSAHSSGLGRPIKGDKLYGSPSEGPLFLHAETLGLHHPTTGKELFFRSL